jgi:ABC-2 type transport system permease protein
MMRALAVARKELRQIARDRRSMLILLFIPAFFLFLYGYALNFDIRNVRLGIQDRDVTVESRTLVSAFTGSAYFDAVAAVRTDADAEALMARDEIRALLVIPEGFSRQLGRGETADVQIVINGDNANTATTVLGYANAVLSEAQARLTPSMPRNGAAAVAITAAPRVWYNPELRSTLFLVPGLIAYIAMITAVVSTALSIVREKESGTMEQIRMAPISTGAFVIGKLLPYLVISQASAMLVIVAAMGLFGLPMRGDWLVLMVVLAVFLIGALGTGLLVSTMADDQQTAFQAAMLIAFLPTFILSGFIFPIASMPVVLQYVTTLVPARYFLIALRGVVLKGLALPDLWPPLAALSAYAAAVLALSAVRLARR